MTDENRTPQGTRQWKEITDDIREDTLVKLEVDQAIEGVYLGTRIQNANGRATQIYMFDTPDNGVVGLWETAQLARKMNRARKNKYTRVQRLNDIPAKLIGYSDEQDFFVGQSS